MLETGNETAKAVCQSSRPKGRVLRPEWEKTEGGVL